jgi:hypothetical protein
MVLRLGELPWFVFHPIEQCGRRQMVTVLSIPCSPSYSGAFIAVVAGCRWTPFSTFSEVLPLPAAEADQVSELQVIYVMSWLTEVRPSTLLPPLPWWVRLNSSRSGCTYRSLDSISQVNSLVKATSISVRLRISSYKLRSANKLSGTVAGEW